MSTRRAIAGLVATGVLALLSAAPAAAVGYGQATPGATTTTDLLASATPKTAVLAPATGAIVAVSLGEPAAVLSLSSTPAISSGTGCQPGDGCYYTPTVNFSYHDRSFYGSPGTFTGDWPRRNAWDTGRYTASACWQSACSQAFGPNTYLTFGGSLVTGTSFTIR
ncbi:MAG: hypothetical protein ACRDLT_16365 [Solirubrobacteraceae bacterium]